MQNKTNEKDAWREKMSEKIEHINWHLKKGFTNVNFGRKTLWIYSRKHLLKYQHSNEKRALFTPKNLLVNMPFVFCVFRSEMMMTKRERDGNKSPESHLHKGSKTKALHIAQYSLSGHKAQVK